MSLLPDPLSLLASLVALPGPPGQEGAVRHFVSQQLTAIGCLHETDGKGNLLAGLPGFPIPRKPRIVVTAHLDEIALLVTAVLADELIQPRHVQVHHLLITDCMSRNHKID